MDLGLGIDNETLVGVLAFAALALAVVAGAVAFALWYANEG